MADPAVPVAGLSADHQQHVQKITRARHDPWGDPHGGALAGAVTDAHRAGVPHSVIAHYSGFPIERVARMASFAKNDGDPFGLNKKLNDPNGNAFQRQPHRNTRRQNVAVGASVGAGLYGGLGAVAGGTHGRKQAKAGLGLLHSVGAAPSKARSAGIVAGHSARSAGKVGAVLGAAGATYGAAVGAVTTHRKDSKKLPMGRVQKSDRHMSPEPRKGWAMSAPPKHSVEAGAIRTAAGAKKPLGAAAAVRGTLRATTLGKSAFGVQHVSAVEKATESHKTDPARLATGALFPGIHGAVAGRHGRKLRAAGHEVGGATLGSVVPGPGTVIGAGVGTHYADQKGYYKPIKKGADTSAFGVEHEVAKKKIGVVLPGVRAADRGKGTFKPMKARGGGDGPGKGSQGGKRGERQGRV